MSSTETSTALRVQASTPDLDNARDDFVVGHRGGTFFHRAGWRRVVEYVFGNVPRDLVALRGEEVVGVLPLMEASGLLGGKNLLSVPYGVYGGAVGETREVEELLVAEAKRLAERERVGHLELRYRDDPGLDMPSTVLYSTFLKELPDTPEGVLAGMPKKSRAEARKARNKHGLELTRGVWYLDDLYRMFFWNKHSLGSPALPRKMFQALVSEFGDQVHVHIVRQEREPMAAVMSFVDGDTLIAYYSGTRPDADRAVSASNFMYMALQEWAVREGFRVFDFGRSRADSGAFRFKVHQGFEPEPLHYRYHLVRSRHLPSFTPSNPKTRLLQAAWRKLPPWLARSASNAISSYLP